jgi:hypothetical protein
MSLYIYNLVLTPLVIFTIYQIYKYQVMSGQCSLSGILIMAPYRALSDLFSFAVLSGNVSMAVHFGSARMGRRGRMGRMGEKRKRGSPFFVRPPPSHLSHSPSSPRSGATKVHEKFILLFIRKI